MYINGFTRIIFFSLLYIWYTKLGVTRIVQLSQRNGKFPLPRLKQGNYPVIPIYGGGDFNDEKP